MLPRDVEQYERLLRSVAQISGLFSSSDVPYIDSRFAEKLFVLTTGAADLGRADKSFDALLDGGIGVGIKTFVAGSNRHSYEKVAEFTALAREGHFKSVGKEAMVRRIARARNTRVSSNVEEYGIDLDACVYHCLIRLEGGAIVHEEPYELIDISGLRPLTKSGKPADEWSGMGKGIYFTDGRSHYSFSISKSVLYKRFNFDRTKGFIPLDIHPEPLALLDELAGRKKSSMPKSPGIRILLDDDSSWGVPGVDYVILPLYSPRDHAVHPKSGINQWNAGGRKRVFGEAYVPLPAEIRDRYPTFFPPQDVHFELELPNSGGAHRAKVCQQGGKALMTETNVELGRWLISVIDPSVRPRDFDTEPSGKRPYTYEDLVVIGSDCVVVRRSKNGGRRRYSIEFAPLGSYEEFLDSAL
jgi:hypothetical protein